MSIADLPKLFTEAQLAAHLDVNPETLARARRAGKIPYTRIGSRVRYTAAHLNAYLESRRSQQPKWIEWKPGDVLPADGLYWCAFKDGEYPRSLRGPWPPKHFELLKINAYWSQPLPPPFAQEPQR